MTANVVVPYPDYSVPIERPYFTTGVYAVDGALLLSGNVANPGFEVAGVGGADVFDTWAEAASDGAIAIETTSVHGGSNAAKLTAGTNKTTYITSGLMAAVEGYTYVLSFWTRGDNAYAGRYGIYDYTHSAYITAVTSTDVIGDTYTQVTKTFGIPLDCVWFDVEFWCPSTNTGIAYFDDVSVGYLWIDHWELAGPDFGLTFGYKLLIRGGSQMQSPRVDVPFADYSIPIEKPEWA